MPENLFQLDFAVWQTMQNLETKIKITHFPQYH